MSRPIDADALNAAIEKWFDGVCVYDVSPSEAVNDFQSIVEEQPTITANEVRPVPKWISVEERLPHYLDHVLCVNKFGIQMVGHLTDYKEGGFRCESGMDSCDYITHWMSLPDPPKEVE